MRTAVEAVTVVLALLAVGLLTALLGARLGRDLVESRRQRRDDALRQLLFRAVLADDVSADDLEQLRTIGRGRSGRALERRAFRLLALVSGDVHLALVRLLSERGAGERAVAMTRSILAVRRCRGAHSLGLLGSRDAAPVLRALLDDRDPLVRRVAVRALGQVGDAGSVAALVEMVTRDPALTRDTHAAVAAIGAPAVPALTRLVRARLDGGQDPEAVVFCVRALGDIGAFDAVPLLVELAGADDPPVVAAAAQALGRIGSPGAVPVLVSALTSPDAAVRAAAATSLGEIGEPAAAEALDRAIDGRSDVADRAAAAALLRLGRRGLEVLAANPSPYAHEALAVAQVRVGR